MEETTGIERPGNKLRVAAIGDVHASPSHRGQWHDTFAEVSREADVLCLCGDLTNIGTAAEAEALAEDLRACTIPVLAVLGNHDHQCGSVEELEKVMVQAGVQFLENETVEIGGVGFAGVKGFAGGFDGKMLDAFGEAPIKAFVQEAIEQAMRLEHALKALETERRVVVLHYAPIADTVAGEPEAIFPFLGSSRLAETIDRFEGISAIFHGHAHRGTYHGKTRRGYDVYNVAAHIEKPTGKPYALIEV
ncbi:metallophosphoesterase family protein [Indioceanicola profundi]|uniref:metallophosphoesterase family protein n=1 Tax=Indioceanicola profundi TaxID=2220096 RepID=UPI000E6AA099|nr:metallophosphoesterase [Indioceanicola profundi]